MTTTLLALALALAHPNACRVEVRDGADRPVPLIELRTTHGLRFVSDNAGRVALDAPELFGVPTWFTVVGHGVGVDPDGFGTRGVSLTPSRGGHLTVRVKRTSIARRLGRATGAGLFAESQKLGLASPLPETGVFGCDTVQTALHGGKLYWFWGDTTLPGYPLGVFDGTGATTAPKPVESFEPPLAVAFAYERAEVGKPKGVAPMPGSGPTWITGVASLPDHSGTPRLVCGYAKIDPPLATYRFGLAVWDGAKREFAHLKTVWERGQKRSKPPLPQGHASFWTDPAGVRWLLFGNPLPTFRCRATFESWSDPAQWERLTPQRELRDAAGKPVVPHSGSVAYSEYRDKWVAVFVEKFGKPSAFGEVWYAEAPTPTGPWGTAVKILTHDNTTFYNPKIHAEFSGDTPTLIFEGTYTAEFADHAPPTPRYNYNQIWCRLDLDDPRLAAAR